MCICIYISKYNYIVYQMRIIRKSTVSLDNCTVRSLKVRIGVPKSGDSCGLEQSSFSLQEIGGMALQRTKLQVRTMLAILAIKDGNTLLDSLEDW